MNIRRRIRFSNHWAARLARGLYYLPDNVSLPCPTPLLRVLLFVFILLRSTVWFCQRVFFAEPLFKAYCTRYGKRLRTGKFLHWIQGAGEILIGDYVTIDGKCSFAFAARYCDHPQLIIGDHTGISHGCDFRIGKRIIIGKYCRLAGGVEILDTPGHASDPEARMAGLPAPDSEVRPVIIEDNVWIGRRATIYPGVRIGANAIVASNSAVFTDVLANSIVGGNPARQMGVLRSAGPSKQAIGENPRTMQLSFQDPPDIAETGKGTTPISKEIIDVIKQIGNIQTLSSEQDFYSAGLSSMGSLTLMLDLEERYQVVLPDEQFVDCRTAREVCLLISRLRQSDLHEVL